MEREDSDGAIFCRSCGVLLATPRRPVRSWGHSHTLPKGRFPAYATLMKNIAPRCQDFTDWKGCHNALDDGDFQKIKKFRDLDDIMELYAELEPTEYNKFVSGLKKVNVNTYEYLEI